jgi:hypothetical protein
MIQDLETPFGSESPPNEIHESVAQTEPIVFEERIILPCRFKSFKSVGEAADNNVGDTAGRNVRNVCATMVVVSLRQGRDN